MGSWFGWLGTHDWLRTSDGSGIGRFETGQTADRRGSGASAGSDWRAYWSGHIEYTVYVYDSIQYTVCDGDSPGGGESEGQAGRRWRAQILPGQFGGREGWSRVDIHTGRGFDSQ